jgi:DedD protein
LKKERNMAQMETLEESPAADGLPAEDDDALRKRLLSRIAVAGVAIVGLLGGLAVYDSINKPQVPVMPPMAAAPAEPPVVEEKPAEEKSTPDEAEPAATAAPTEEVVPERSETAFAPPPAEKPMKMAKPLTAPATARRATMKPSEPAATAATPERTAPAHAPASRPLARAAETARRFLGVFGNHANAEELVTKLQAAGIPAQIESHVQVGPFASRAEADAARAKLKSLGIDDGLLVRR